MEANKIVLHFKDGSLLKGSTNDFFQNKKNFHISRLDGKMEEIAIERLKSVFFVKDLTGDNRYVYDYESVIAGGGKRISVDFTDGEKIIGYVLGYSPQRQGFMMTPSDLNGNNERIFVVNSATKSVNFLANDPSVHETSRPEKHEAYSVKVAEKRKYPRVASVNLMSYVCFDEDQKPLEQGMGKTLDLGLGGLLMETKIPIEAKYILLMAINLKEELIKIRGEVVYCREPEPNIFHSGVRFIEKNERIREVVTDMIKAFVKMKVPE